MMRVVQVLWVSAMLVAAATGLPACGGEPQPAEQGTGGGAVAEQPASTPATPEAGPAPAEPARTTLVGEGRLTGDAGAAPAVVVELSYGEDKLVEGTLRIGETARRIGGVVDGDRLRCWLSGGDDGGEVQRGMLNGDASAGGGFSGSFAVSTDGAAEVLRGTWKAAPK